MHLNAAIALSELGNCSRSESGPSNLISAVVGQVSRGALIDVGVQTDLQSSRKRSAETQTRKGRKMAARTYKKKAGKLMSLFSTWVSTSTIHAVRTVEV